MCSSVTASNTFLLENNVCSFCQEELDQEGVVRKVTQLACDHFAHSACIEEGKERSCTLCSRAVPLNVASEDEEEIQEETPGECLNDIALRIAFLGVPLLLVGLSFGLLGQLQS